MMTVTTPATIRMYPIVDSSIQSRLTFTAKARIAPSANMKIPNPMLMVELLSYPGENLAFPGCFAKALRVRSAAARGSLEGLPAPEFRASGGML